MENNFLGSDQSSVAGIGDAGNVKGSPDLVRVVKRQANRVSEPKRAPGEDLGEILLLRADKYCTTYFKDLPAELARLQAENFEHSPYERRNDEVA